MNYKLIAIDMDGTMLNDAKQILPETIDALKRAAAAGKYVVVCTGRGRAELDDYNDVFLNDCISYAICVSGAHVFNYKTMEAICDIRLPEETVRVILDAAASEHPMLHSLAAEKSIASAEDIEHMEDFDMIQYQPMFRRCATKVKDADAYIRENAAPNKINLYHVSGESRQRTADLLKGLPVTYALCENTALEVTPAGITKKKGLIALCEFLGITAEETIVVGDSYNDLDALSAAGLSVAMGNSRQEIKDIADVVTEDNNHNGVGIAIDRWLLNS